MKKRVVIVGGGLAGLAAAFELSQDGGYEVHLLELEDRLGGRTCTQDVTSVPVDFGGFIIYPWYSTFHSYIKKLGLKKELYRLPDLPIYYDTDRSFEYKTQKSVTSLIKQDYHVTKFLRIIGAPSLLHQNPGKPSLDTYSYNSMQELLRSCKKDPHAYTELEAFFDTVSQGYCYAPLEKTNPSVGFPVIVKSLLFGGVNRSFYFKRGLTVLHEAMRKEIETTGGAVHLLSPVTSVDFNQKIVHTGHDAFPYDSLIFAQPYDGLTQSALQVENMDAEYTTFCTIAISCAEIPRMNDQSDWGALFLKRTNTQFPQILSVVNLETLYGIKGGLNLNIHFNSPREFCLRSDCVEIIDSEFDHIFPSIKGVTIEHLQFWPKTMPIMTNEIIQTVRSKQGARDVYYAGDYLGSPSMETALMTGAHAASLVQKNT